MHICENCGKEHDGTYGSGRFCCNWCAHSNVAKQLSQKHPETRKRMNAAFVAAGRSKHNKLARAHKVPTRAEQKTSISGK